MPTRLSAEAVDPVDRYDGLRPPWLTAHLLRRLPARPPRLVGVTLLMARLRAVRRR